MSNEEITLYLSQPCHGHAVKKTMLQLIIKALHKLKVMESLPQRNLHFQE